MDSLVEMLKNNQVTAEAALQIFQQMQKDNTKDELNYYSEKLVRQESVGLIEKNKEILLFTDDMSEVDGLKVQFQQHHCNVKYVLCHHHRQDEQGFDYELEMKNSSELDTIFANLEEEKFVPDVISFLNVQETFDFSFKEVNDLSWYANFITNIVKHFQFMFQIKYCFIWRNQTMDSSFTGKLRTIRLENPNFIYKSILDQSNNHPIQWEALVKELLEKSYQHGNYVYEGQNRYKKVITNITDEVQETCNVQEQIHNKTFIISGGMGGLGLIVANYLRGHQAKKVCLLGRKRLSKSMKETIEGLNQGSHIFEYYHCDITELTSVEETISEILARYHQVDGLFHCAGIAKDGLMNTINHEFFSQTLAAKCVGLVNLLETFTKFSCIVPFTKVFSSITSILGNVGQVPYAFANGLVNGLANDTIGKYGVFHVQALCWPLWKNGGMQVDGRKIKGIFEQTGEQILEDTMGLEALQQMWNSSCKVPLILYGKQKKINEFLNENQTKEIEINNMGILNKREEITVEQVIDYVRELVANVIAMPVHKLDIKTNWDFYGIDSLSIMRVNDEMKKVIPNLAVTVMYECGNVYDLAQLLYTQYRDKLDSVINHTTTKNIVVKPTIILNNDERVYPKEQKHSYSAVHKNRLDRNRKKKDIAIIGMAGRYPMAENLDEFWENLLSGRDCVQEIPTDRWDYEEYYHADKTKKGYTNSKWGGFIKDFNCFDAGFFHMTPREARYIDPQERIFLECSWHALEDAGYVTDDLAKQEVGVYVGVMYSHYQLYGLEFNEPGQRKAYNSSYSSIANRVSYYFNMSGPSMAVDTMCSSSLTAIHLARESILRGECSMAIAGGVNLTLHPNKYINLSQNNFLSSDGRCRSFGDGGDGYVPGEGVGAVILKELDQAIADGDYIYGVIKSTAINHGGRANGFTVPNPTRQTEVIKRAMKEGHIKPEQYSYIETHGTGTPLGDPIELKALQNAFGKLNESCPIGSVKSNIGHCEAASGVAGLMKMILQMKHKQLVPSIHCNPLNKNIDFHEFDFYVQKELTSWEHKMNHQRELPYVSGLSSFGAGGSNAHVIVQEYKESKDRINEQKLSYNILLISAKSMEDLFRYASIYLQFLQESKRTDCSFEHIAYATQHYRNTLSQRLAIVASDYDEAIDKLQSFINQESVETMGIFYNDEDDDNDYEQRIHSHQSSLREQDVFAIAKECVNIKGYDWTVLWGNTRYPKIKLPLYPFERVIYWIDEKTDKREGLQGTFTSRLINESTLFEQKYTTTYWQKDAFVQDHVIKGECLLPGAAMLLNAKTTLNLATSNHLAAICNWTFVAPVTFSHAEEQLVSTMDGNAMRYVMKSRQGGTDKTICTAQFELSSNNNQSRREYVDLTQIKSGCYTTYDGTKLYEDFKSNKQYYGNSLQVIDQIQYSNETALVSYKHISASQGNSLLFHIPYIDGAFQGLYVFKEQLGLKPGETMLPYKITRMEWLNELTAPKYVYIQKDSSQNRFDLSIVDESGLIGIKITGFTVMRVQQNGRDAVNIDEALRAMQDDHMDIDAAAELIERWLENA